MRRNATARRQHSTRNGGRLSRVGARCSGTRRHGLNTARGTESLLVKWEQPAAVRRSTVSGQHAERTLRDKGESRVQRYMTARPQHSTRNCVGVSRVGSFCGGTQEYAINTTREAGVSLSRFQDSAVARRCEWIVNRVRQHCVNSARGTEVVSVGCG